MLINRKHWITGLVLAMVCLFFGSCIYGLIHKESGVNVAQVDWLPREATNISYFRSYLFTAYEFKISEDGFKTWCPFSVEPITKPIVVDRYLVGLESSGSAGKNFEDALTYFARVRVGVSNGLYYYRVQQNGGYTVYAYDRDRGKAYMAGRPR